MKLPWRLLADGANVKRFTGDERLAGWDPTSTFESLLKDVDVRFAA